MTATDWLILVLATLTAYRVTRLVTTDSLFMAQRVWVFLRWPPNRDWARTRRVPGPNGTRVLVQEQQPDRRYPRKLGQLIECDWCIGFWLTGAVWGLVWYYRPLVLPGLWWPAMAAGVGVLATMLEQ